MNKLSLITCFSKFVKEHSRDKEERIRLLVFIIGNSLLILFLLLHIVSFSFGLKNPFLQGISWTLLAITIGTVTAYLSKKLTLIQTFISCAIGAQLLESTRIVFLTLVKPAGYENMVVGCQIGSYSILLYLTLGLVPNAPTCVTVMSLASLFFAGFYDGGIISGQLIIIFVLLTAFTCILACIIQRGLHDVQQESHRYQSTQADILHTFSMSQSELIAYLQLCRSTKPNEQNVTLFFDQLDEQSKHNLIHAVETLKSEREAEQLEYAKAFPHFTETELEVCRLVVAGRTLNEIARIMGKSSSNVSTVRGNIRKKLNMQPQDNLQAVLKERAKSCWKINKANSR